MKIAFLGAGQVGGALAVALSRAGHSVTVVARDATSESVRELAHRERSIAVATP